MLQQEAIESLIAKAYASVPGLNCADCVGDCCVSPTMTAPEFVRMMHYAQIHFGDKLAGILSQPSREHLLYADNAFCRFQAQGGMCANYEGRALACRLHGHEAMRNFAAAGTEFCARSPAGNHAMPPQQVEHAIESIREVLALADIPYTSPYFLLSLNLECWLDFAYHAEWCDGRPSLLPTRTYLDRYLELPPLSPAPQHTTLHGKLKAIDKLFAAIESGDAEEFATHIRELQTDFPSCGSYYLEEAKALEEMAFQQTCESLNPLEQQTAKGSRP